MKDLSLARVNNQKIPHTVEHSEKTGSRLSLGIAQVLFPNLLKGKTVHVYNSPQYTQLF